MLEVLVKGLFHYMDNEARVCQDGWMVFNMEEQAEKKHVATFSVPSIMQNAIILHWNVSASWWIRCSGFCEHS